MNIIEDIAHAKGWKLMMTRKVSDNPDDSQLSYVLVQNQKDEFVTYLFNHEFKGFYHGNYFTDMDKAIEDFTNR